MKPSHIHTAHAAINLMNDHIKLVSASFFILIVYALF